VLVFFMHTGFSLVESGSVRYINVQNILTKNLIVVCFGFLAWYAVGWSFACAPVDEPNKFIGGTEFFNDGFFDKKTKFRNFFFQGIFCATGATIVSGAMAERTQLKGFGIFVAFMTTLIYPVVVYWGWSGSGLLSYTEDDEGKSVVGAAYMDFAGSGIVHMVGGIGALCGAAVVGPRKGRFDPAVDEEKFTPHNIPFTVLGTFCLWFGWYGFNSGSTLSMHDEATAHTAGIVAVNTTLAPCIAGLVVFCLRAKVALPLSLDVCGFCNGILGGLVSITAPCAVVKSWEAVIIGFVGGFVFQGTSMLMKILKIDDVVDAIAVHGACGLWGMIAIGLFGNPDEGIGGNGAFYGGDQLGTQLFAAVLIAVWVTSLSLAVFIPLKHAGMLRLSDAFQDVGADVMEHSPRKSYRAEDGDNALPDSKKQTKETPEDGDSTKLDSKNQRQESDV
jgi:Amt family ammonium transporter